MADTQNESTRFRAATTACASNGTTSPWVAGSDVASLSDSPRRESLLSSDIVIGAKQKRIAAGGSPNTTSTSDTQTQSQSQRPPILPRTYTTSILLDSQNQAEVDSSSTVATSSSSSSLKDSEEVVFLGDEEEFNEASEESASTPTSLKNNAWTKPAYISGIASRSRSMTSPGPKANHSPSPPASSSPRQGDLSPPTAAFKRRNKAHKNHDGSVVFSPDLPQITAALTFATNHKHAPTAQQIAELNLLPGEVVKARVKRVLLLHQTDTSWPTTSGNLYVTNYQLIHKCTDGSQRDTSLPLMMMNAMKRKVLGLGLGKNKTQIKIFSKDLRSLKFTFHTRKIDALYSYLQRYLNPDPKLILFAWYYSKPQHDPTNNGWIVYDPFKEFGRMKITTLCSMSLPSDKPSSNVVDSDTKKSAIVAEPDGLGITVNNNPLIQEESGWVLTDINRGYAACSTYPKYLVVPAGMTAYELKSCFEFRSKGRIPVLSWRHPRGMTITRCSQPMVGIGKSRNEADEKLLSLIKASSRSGYLRIIDARPKVNAIGNQAAGAGFETMSFYKNCSLDFMNIENIHVMRESLNNLFLLLKKKASVEDKWHSSVEATGWLKHIRTVLQSAVKIVNLIEEEGSSVLVHCSDGWDRTAQLVSLAELMLDPHYRTIHGVQVLIEKEWLQFGHKFALRCGHHEGAKSTSSEKSPIFIQWVECVWHLIQQFPVYFEFNENFLFALCDHAYSCKYGTFLFNCAYERDEAGVQGKTVSIWTDINEDRFEYTNPLYTPFSGVLRPCCNAPKFQVWPYFFKEDFTLRPKDTLESHLRDLTLRLENARSQANDKKNQAVKAKKMHLREVVDLVQTQRRQSHHVHAVLEAKLVIEQLLNNVFAVVEQKINIHRLKMDSRGHFVPPSWVPDSWAKRCAACNRVFTQVRRKHHCRNCGRVFCGACSNKRVEIPEFLYFRPVRICDECHTRITSTENGPSALARGSSPVLTKKQISDAEVIMLSSSHAKRKPVKPSKPSPSLTSCMARPISGVSIDDTQV